MRSNPRGVVGRQEQISLGQHALPQRVGGRAPQWRAALDLAGSGSQSTGPRQLLAVDDPHLGKLLSDSPCWP